MATAVTPIINENTDSKLVETVLNAVIEGIGGSSIPTRTLAEAMLVKAGAALADIAGREEADRMLRALADQLERCLS